MPRMLIQTSVGAITLELDAGRAPVTVKNIIGYIESGHYEGTLFHRVIDGFMIQGGGFDSSFQKRSAGAPIQNEAGNGLKNTRGSVAMARTSEVQSATCQFFINVSDNSFLDHKDDSPEGYGYAVFGHVVDGMDVVDQIKGVPTGAKGPFKKDCPLTDVVIQSITLLD